MPRNENSKAEVGWPLGHRLSCLTLCQVAELSRSTMFEKISTSNPWTSRGKSGNFSKLSTRSENANHPLQPIHLPASYCSRCSTQHFSCHLHRQIWQVKLPSCMKGSAFRDQVKKPSHPVHFSAPSKNISLQESSCLLQRQISDLPDLEHCEAGVTDVVAL
jgi:hypothetical protein